MEYIPMSSSNIKEIAYNSKNKELHIRFTSGALYTYFEVPESAFTDFKNADSAGGYFSSEIKNVFTYERIE